MRNFGPFDSYADALKAACPLILSKPNATVGHLKDLDPGLARRTATVVNDPRYKPGDLKYIFALHNHPFGKQLSLVDLHFIEAMASQHDWKTETINGEIYLSIIAFFSQSGGSGAPACDGFHQYVPATRELMTWEQTRDGWKNTDDGILRWLDDRRYIIERRQRR